MINNEEIAVDNIDREEISFFQKIFLYLKKFYLLHLIFIFYSVISVMSKFAARYDLLSIEFLLVYCLILLLTAIYALFWQLIIKRYELSVAYSHKAMVIVWVLIWSVIFYKETITPTNLLGTIFIIIGIQFVTKNED